MAQGKNANTIMSEVLEGVDPEKAVINCGCASTLAIWYKQSQGMNWAVTDKMASFRGIPVVETSFLPFNGLALVVDGKISNLIVLNLDLPEPPDPSETIH